MDLLQYIGPASGLLFTLENILWINLGVLIGAVFAAIPGLSVILCWVSTARAATADRFPQS